MFYTELNFKDSFQNRINLIFLHLSFLFIKIKQEINNKHFKSFYQRMFDFTFNQIEANMREIGYSDTTVSKNMKFLVKSFYNILLNSEKFNLITDDQKIYFLLNYLKVNNDKKVNNNAILIEYFDKYYAFCLDLSSDKVLKGDLNFTYK